jgi:hypothetical protein
MPGLIHRASNIKARLPSLNITRFQASSRDATLTINSRIRHSSTPFKVRQVITYNL